MGGRFFFERITSPRTVSIHRNQLPAFIFFQAYVDQLLENGRRFDSSSDTSDSRDEDSGKRAPKPKQFYKFKFLPKKYLKIYFDRLALLALLDR